MTDDRYIELALDEASRVVGRTSPNPPVGSVVVKEGVVLAAGGTEPAGGSHAEVVALKLAGRGAKGATLYTTLEPCCHHGRTGPCTEKIQEAGIRRVVLGSRDRNPKVSGEGVKCLRRHGIEVTIGVLEEPCNELNAHFFTWVTTGRPYVVLKAAMTLDGRIATRTGDSKWVSGPASRELVHQWRNRFDAILVGAGTVKADNPRLTARLAGEETRDPLRVILDGRLSTDPKAKVYRQRSKAPTIVVVPERTSAAKRRPFGTGHNEVVGLPGKNGRVDLGALLDELGRRNVVSLMVEGGAEVHGQFLSGGFADELRLFLAPKLLGEGPAWLEVAKGTGPAKMSKAWSLDEVELEPLDDDLLMTAMVRRR